MSIASQVVELLRLPVPDGKEEEIGVEPLAMNDGIRLDGLSFSYPAARALPAIQDVSMEVPRGSMLALVGQTGSGKTTLADLLMGLVEPSAGQLLIDDVSLSSRNAQRWQRNIAHVPQSIFLTDSTIARNIALSLPHSPPDAARIVDAARKAQLHEFIASLPNGYETHVGERGVRLSGGQRQRLGIARAIYKDAPVLVLDEATSALDELTEGAVLDALQQLRKEGRTIIIVAHRFSTIRHCDLVARLDHGRLAAFGPFAELFPVGQ
jgi:ABC-type multidrug transport system fused ATPase/permease subunit